MNLQLAVTDITYPKVKYRR